MNKSPCKKGCEQRSMDCRLRCDAYKKYWEDKKIEYKKRADAMNAIPDSAAKVRMCKINTRNRLRGRR